MAMQSVGLPLMPEQAGVGRETQLGIHASRDLATVRLQMRIQVFAIGYLLATCLGFGCLRAGLGNLLVSAFLGSGRVVAWLLSVGKWAVVFSVTLGGHRVVRMLSRVTRFTTILGSLSGGLLDGQRREELGLRFHLGLGSIWKCTSTSGLRWPNSPARGRGRSVEILFCCIARGIMSLLGPTC